jgi:hypothetical protein
VRRAVLEENAASMAANAAGSGLLLISHQHAC